MLKFLRGLRAVREHTSEPVSEDVVREILDVGSLDLNRREPTAHRGSGRARQVSAAEVRRVGRQAGRPERCGAAAGQLVRLKMLHRDVVPQLDPSGFRVNLSLNALYSTYQDLQEQGLEAEAR